MAEQGGFRAPRRTFLPVFAMAFLANVLVFSAAGPGTLRSSAGGVAPLSRVATPEAPVDPAPPTSAPRLVIESEKTPEPGPALWVGAVVGIGGLVGLVFSSVGRARRRNP